MRASVPVKYVVPEINGYVNQGFRDLIIEIFIHIFRVKFRQPQKLLAVLYTNKLTDMKKLLLLVLLTFTGITANSQVLISLLLGDVLNSEKIEFGLDGGVNFANISNLDPGKSVAFFNLGFYFDIKFEQNLMLHTGVQVKANQGADHLATYSLADENLNSVFSSGHVTRKISQFSVPILLKYRFATLFHVEGGPMLALRSKGFDEFKNTYIDKDDVTYKIDIRDNYKRIDAGIMVGAGVKMSKIPKSSQLGIRYYYGLVDPLKNNTGKSQNFSSLYLYFSIPIGVAKSEKN
jgi:hypothetical protein